MNYSNWEEFISYYKKNNNISSTSKLAKKMKISQPYLSQIENGSRKPSIEVIEKMADNLGTDHYDKLALKNIFLSLSGYKYTMDTDINLNNPNEDESGLFYDSMVKNGYWEYSNDLTNILQSKKIELDIQRFAEKDTINLNDIISTEKTFILDGKELDENEKIIIANSINTIKQLRN